MILPYYYLLNDTILLSTQVNANSYKSNGSGINLRMKLTKNLTMSSNLLVENVKVSFNKIYSSNYIFTGNTNLSYTFSKGYTARLRANYSSTAFLLQEKRLPYSGIEISLNKNIGKKWILDVRARDFLNSSSIRINTLSSSLFNQENKTNLNLAVYAIAMTYNFGKIDFSNQTKVKINNRDLKN